MRNETADALVLATKILSRISADPDDDIAVLARQFERAHAHNTQLQTAGTEQVSQYRQLQRKYDEIVAVLIAAKVPVRTITETVIHPQIKIRDRLIEQLKTANAELALTLKRTLDIVHAQERDREAWRDESWENTNMDLLSRTLEPDTAVIVRLDDGSDWPTITRSKPWQLGDGTWVVQLEGKAGGYSLKRVRRA